MEGNVKDIFFFCHFTPQILRAKPSAPTVPTEEDTLQYFDAVIASCDSEPMRKPYTDDGHADVDFIGEFESFQPLTLIILEVSVCYSTSLMANKQWSHRPNNEVTDSLFG